MALDDDRHVTTESTRGRAGYYAFMMISLSFFPDNGAQGLLVTAAISYARKGTRQFCVCIMRHDFRLSEIVIRPRRRAPLHDVTCYSRL